MCVQRDEDSKGGAAFGMRGFLGDRCLVCGEAVGSLSAGFGALRRAGHGAAAGSAAVCFAAGGWGERACSRFLEPGRGIGGKPLGNLRDHCHSIKILMKKYKMPDSICDNPKQQIGYWFENGVQLSGGQWQRLAICRTMARDNEILLLDEPNAALDAITFRMLYNEINAQANRKVCVMLLQHFVNFIGGNEEICVFDDGKLISRGKHDRLYDTCRIYKELYDAQQ